MSRIALIRTDQAMPDARSLDAIRGFLFGVVDGFSRDDKSAWHKFWRRIKDLEPGEMAQVEMVFPRNGKFHRKFFALLGVGFDAWEPPRSRKKYKGIPVVKNFEQFREDVTIAAGFYEQTFDLNGRMKLKAKSIKFANMDEAEFEKVYSAVADVLLGSVLSSYVGRAELDAVVNKVMGFV